VEEGKGIKKEWASRNERHDSEKPPPRRWPLGVNRDAGTGTPGRGERLGGRTVRGPRVLRGSEGMCDFGHEQ